MTWRRAAWVGVAVVALAGFAVLMPGSPIFLVKFFSSAGQYQGRSTHFWIQSLNDPDAAGRQKAIFALGTIGEEAGAAVPALSKILVEDPDLDARKDAALALSKMAPTSRAAVPALAQALADKEPNVRINSTLALFRLGPEARPAIPALIEALEDASNQTNCKMFTFTIREMAARALGRASAGSAEAVPALTAALNPAGPESLRIAVARALGDVGAEARPAVPQLKAMLQDSSSAVRLAAKETLEKIEGKQAEN